MDDALRRIGDVEEAKAMPCRIGGKPVDHAGNLGIGDRGAVPRRHVVIRDAEGQTRLGKALATRFQCAESVMRSLMHEMPVDPEQRLAILAHGDDMAVP